MPMPPDLRYEVHGADTLEQGCADGCGCVGVVFAVAAVVAALLEVMSG